MGYEEKRGPRDGGRGFDARRGGGKPYAGKDGRGSRPYGDKPRGGRPSGDRFRDSSRGDRRDDRRGGDRPYGDKPYGKRDDRRSGDRSFGDKPYGKRDDRRGGDRRGGDRPYGGKPRGDFRGGKSFGDKSRGPRRDDVRAREPRTGTSEDFKNYIERLDGRGYGSYRDLFGTYSFDGFELSIDYVQADPFASPSRLTIRVPQDIAEFPVELFDTPWKQTALEDAVLRQFGRMLAQNACHFPDFIKGGSMFATKPGAEILKRTACAIDENEVVVRFEAHFPSRDRSVTARDMCALFIDALPRVVRDALLHVSHDAAELQAVADLADDQHALRAAIAERGLVAFVADGAVLPRESGVSTRPMSDAVAFESPESLRVTVELPHVGVITGMGVPRGVTLVVGGGYHGKTTLVKAIEAGVYDHVAGDGREFVVCDETAVKLRAEDGRSVRDVNISLFINNLPNEAATDSFWTDDASGSTSQAASTMEAAEAGARVFVIDEDTSAANFMVRDELMQAVIAPEKEPITPFVERLRSLYDVAGISTIIVAGSSGAFFPVADTVIQMDTYKPVDITERVREVCRIRGVEAASASTKFALPAFERRLITPPHPLMWKTASVAKKENAERRETGKPDMPERLKVKVLGGVDIIVGEVGSDLRFVEQIVDSEQVSSLAHILRWCMERDYLARMTVRELVNTVWEQINEEGLASIGDAKAPASGLALPRKQEIYACINRVRPRPRS